MATPKKQKPNPQDATLRNIRALKNRVFHLEESRESTVGIRLRQAAHSMRLDAIEKRLKELGK
jgi:hypothetical protein